jgi:Pentapeptide repeats (8 copies)
MRLSVVLLASVALGGCGKRIENGHEKDEPVADEARVTLSCVALPLQASQASSGADLQAYRFEALLGGTHLVRFERGAPTLFERSAEEARARLTQEGTLGRQLLEREVELRLEAGALVGVWSDGELEASYDGEDFYSGQATFESDAREVVCWRVGRESRFLYDSTSGKCRDSAGALGMNILPVIYVRETGDGECNSFGEVSISTNASAIYAGLNLRGADLSRSSMIFATVPHADFSGANLDGLATGYLDANGLRDAHTRLGPGMTDAEDGTIYFGDVGVHVDAEEPYYGWRFPCASRPLAVGCKDL